MLDDPASQHLICWAGRKLEFKLNEPEEVARLWGIQKNRPTMNYDKLSRSLRYYYEKGIISKVSGERYVYRFAYEPEVLAKLTLDDTLTAVLPAKPGKNWNSTSSTVQDVIFPPPVLPPPNQTLPPPAPVQTLPPLPTPSAPVSEAQALPQEVMYQAQWEDQAVYNNTYEYEWSDTSMSTGFLSYPVNQQYEHAYSCEQINQVYTSTDTEAENYVFLEYPDYFS